MYEVIGIALHSETKEEMVIYKVLSQKEQLWVRPKTMFFEHILYEGNITLLKKEVKSIREQISNTDGLQRFIDRKVHYYIKEADKYHTIKRKKDLLTLFSSHKKQVQQYIRENHLSYRKDRDNTLIKVTAYYDGLKK